MHVSTNPMPSGLIIAESAAAIPLRGVRIHGEVDGLCSRVTVSQRYENTEPVPVEAVYVFPLEEGSAVDAFSVRIGDRLIEGRVEEKEKAFEIYDDAMADGHGAFLLDQERPNIFTASVGNLAPGATVEVTVRYVALLATEGDAVRLMLPTTVSPRYVPAGPPEIGEPDGERINPETRGSVPYGLTLDVDIHGVSPIKVVESPSHTVRVEVDGNTAHVSLSQGEVALDRDFVLLVETREPHSPSARVVREEDGTRTVMVTFFPDPEDRVASGRDIVFLLDCSGSMGGDSIDQAKRALALCVRAMSEGDTFNVYRFGSRYESLWPTSKPYRQATLEEASAYIRESDANLGGTEILAPLQAILAASNPGAAPRQMLLLTDGEVSNEAAVIELCGEHREHARIFTFGIGAGASEHLVRGVARASRGAAEFIYPGERIEPKVLRMFERVASPVYTNITVDWGGLSVEQSPAECSAVFGGDALTIFGRVTGTSGGSNKVTLQAGEQSWSLGFDAEKAEASGVVPTLWARHRIRDLEEGNVGRRGSNQSRHREDRVRAEIVELGKRFGLVSSATSYVAVEVRAEADKTTEQAQLRRVPIALTTGWGGARGGLVQAVPGYAAPPMQHFAMAGAPPPPAPAAAPMAARASGAGFGGVMKSLMEGAQGAISGLSRPAPKAKKKAGVKGDVNERMQDAAPAREELHSFVVADGAGIDSFDARADYGMDCDEVAGEAPKADSDALYDLLMTQQADGSFVWSAALERQLGARLAAARAASARHGEGVVCTALVVQILQDTFAARRDEWKAALRKAEAWLERQPTHYDPTSL